MKDYFNRCLNGRDKTYTPRKLARLREYFKGRATETQDACYLYVTARQGQRLMEFRFFIK